MTDLIPGPAIKKLEDKCKTIARNVGKIVPGEKNSKKVVDLLNKEVCKEVRNIDKLILKKVAE